MRSLKPPSIVWRDTSLSTLIYLKSFTTLVQQINLFKAYKIFNSKNSLLMGHFKKLDSVRELV